LRAVYTSLRGKVEPDINSLACAGPAVRPLFEAALGVRSSDLTQDEIVQLRPRADEAMTLGLSEDLWCKTHDALFVGPSGTPTVSAQATRCALYMVRDPRDVAVSLAHHAEMTLTEAVDLLCSSTAALAKSTTCLQPQLPQHLGTWSAHVRSWTESPPFPVHTLRYEDCLASPVATFMAAFAWTGWEATEAEVAEAVARSSFERLQTQEATAGFRERQRGSSVFFRRGSAGGWRDELPTRLARLIEDEHHAVMLSFGYRAV
jgi:hypothetical protein